MRHIARDRIATYRAPGRERLRHMADFLDALPEGVVTLTRWYGYGGGCAVGMAIRLDPWFRAQGLRLVDVGRGAACRPAYEGATDWPAVAAFFGVTLAEAARLFTPAGYDGQVRPPTARMARQIRAFLAARPVAVAA